MNHFHTESFSLEFLVVKLFKFVVVNLVLEFPVFLDHREPLLRKVHISRVTKSSISL